MREREQRGQREREKERERANIPDHNLASKIFRDVNLAEN